MLVQFDIELSINNMVRSRQQRVLSEAAGSLCAASFYLFASDSTWATIFPAPTDKRRTQSLSGSCTWAGRQGGKGRFPLPSWLVVAHSDLRRRKSSWAVRRPSSSVFLWPCGRARYDTAYANLLGVPATRSLWQTTPAGHSRWFSIKVVLEKVSDSKPFLDYKNYMNTPSVSF